MASRRAQRVEPTTPPPRPWLADQPTRFMSLEREVEQEFQPRLLAALQSKVDAIEEQTKSTIPTCSRCEGAMSPHDHRTVFWRARFGRLHARVWRYRCPICHQESRPLLDLLGVEPGRISGSLA